MCIIVIGCLRILQKAEKIIGLCSVPTALGDLRYMTAVSLTYRKSHTYVRKRERSTYMYVCFTKSYDLRVTLKVDRKSTSS